VRKVEKRKFVSLRSLSGDRSEADHWNLYILRIKMAVKIW